MSATEKKKYEDEFHAKVQSGQVTIHKHKIQKDAGKKRAKHYQTEAKETAASSDKSEEEELASRAWCSLMMMTNVLPILN